MSQPEAIIENNLIEQLEQQKYTYRKDIRTQQALEDNFRQKFEALNRVQLTDVEFSRLLADIVTPDVFSNSKKLRQITDFEREDGTPLNYTLVNINDWCKNEFEVINQLRINTETSNHRYDVIILVNGLPLAQIELKRHEIVPKKAIEQIVNYKNDAGNGFGNTLMCFMQLFMVSNGNSTYYFTNNNNEHFQLHQDERFLPVYQWADKDNNKITNLHAFAKDFLPKCTLGQMISRYMVLVETEKKILMMRPYQIYAVKAIMDSIEQNRGNGYIWHTTGSGKTLTSFKASTLMRDNPNIDKCLFVVDRKDLDRQTREEFNKFQEDCVEENTNTKTLVQRLLSDHKKDKVIVTTIQKLGIALDADKANNYVEQLKPLADKRIVFIFDECHRSQFGDNHQAIKAFFPRSQLFGFTGTPIFSENSTYRVITGEEARMKTTDDIFEKELHAYTITHAIEDRNVLAFHIDYFKPEGEQTGTVKRGNDNALAQEAVAKAILQKHNQATNHRRFNAVLACASINHAIEYYRLFKTLQAEKVAEDDNYKPLNIACVFSPPAIASVTNDERAGNEQNQKNLADIKQLQGDLAQEAEDNKIDPEGKKQALLDIMTDYNAQYSTNHSIAKFDDYYKDVQQRIKDHKYPDCDYPHVNKIDITIVVDMLLTGFDSKHLNTLYVDKNLKYHGLIQAFSRTNRVLNDTKPYGNVLDFRAQESQVNDAIKLFSGKDDEENAITIWTVEPAKVVIQQFDEAVIKLQEFMQNEGVSYEPSEVFNLQGDNARAEFIKHFKEIQRLQTQLDQYTDITQEQQESIEHIMPKETLNGFRGVYLETAERLREKQGKGEEETEIDNVDFEFVLFNSEIINYDYINELLANSTHVTPKHEKISREDLAELLSNNANLRADKDDILAYFDTLTEKTELTEADIKQGLEDFRKQRSDNAVIRIAEAHGIDAEGLRAVVKNIMWQQAIDGQALSELMPDGLNWKGRKAKEAELMQDLLPELKKMLDGKAIKGEEFYE
ncbi:MAG: type I restriction endonuclease subunit R [Gammaproteobacteria bacterium]|nr:type I restriction endonuclease subunit R [Gammaproteobacteria bacterium]